MRKLNPNSVEGIRPKINYNSITRIKLRVGSSKTIKISKSLPRRRKGGPHKLPRSGMKKVIVSLQLLDIKNKL